MHLLCTSGWLGVRFERRQVASSCSELAERVTAQVADGSRLSVVVLGGTSVSMVATGYPTDPARSD